MNYAGLAADIFGPEYDGNVCVFCNLNPAVGLACSACAPALRTYGERLGARITRRARRQRNGRKAGK